MPVKRTLGLSALTFYGVGIILGAGIYSLLGLAAIRAGDARWPALALVTGLLVALSGAGDSRDLVSGLLTDLPRGSSGFSRAAPSRSCCSPMWEPLDVGQVGSEREAPETFPSGMQPLIRKCNENERY